MVLGVRCIADGEPTAGVAIETEQAGEPAALPFGGIEHGSGTGVHRL